MKKLNNKGLTLIELIIAIALISVVLVFLYTLLNDFNNELSNTDFSIQNQNERVEIIKDIQEFAFNKYLASVSKLENEIRIVYTDDTITSIKYTTKKDEDNVNVDTIKITNTDKTGDEVTSWKMDEARVDFENVKLTYIDAAENEKVIQVSIPVYTLNERNDKDNNNIIDDLSVVLLGNSSVDLTGLELVK